MESEPASPLRVVLVGVGHVFQLGPQIERLIHNEQPRAVCLELDAARYESLMRGPPDASQMPADAPGAYRRLAKFQQDMAAKFGGDEGVGAEMRRAANAAHILGAQVVLVDKDAQDLVSRIGEEMGVWEKVRFTWETFRVRAGLASQKKLTREVEELERDPTRMISPLGAKFPTVKRILLDERNVHMADRIRDVARRLGHVVAIVGDGHIDGINKLLFDLSPVIHRLKDVRAGRADDTGFRLSLEGDTSSFGFSQEVQTPADDETSA